MVKKTYIVPNTKVIGINVAMLTGVSKEDYTKGVNLDSREVDDRFDWGAADDEEDW